MVPLSLDECEKMELWEKARRRSHLVLVDVSQDRPVSKTVKPRRRGFRPLENIAFGVTVAAVAFSFLYSGVKAAWPTLHSAYLQEIAAQSPTVPVTVRSGDTLWRYAERYGAPDQYILDRIDAIARYNHLPSNAPLIPGQHLRIPVSNPVVLAKLQATSHARVASAQLP